MSETEVVRGVGLTPSQPLTVLEPLLGELELVLVLGIDPGRRDPMARHTGERVEAVRRMARGVDMRLAVDGGVNDTTLDAVAAMGCDVVVAGSAVFGGAGGPGATAARYVARLGGHASA
jgi:ribulose-phosphate 3-epimerase